MLKLLIPNNGLNFIEQRKLHKMKQKLKLNKKREQKEVEKKVEDQAWPPVNHSNLEGYQNLNAEAQQIVQNYRQILFQE